MPRSSLPTSGGSSVETFALPSGLHVPFGVIDAIDPTGAPVSLAANTDGSLHTVSTTDALVTGVISGTGQTVVAPITRRGSLAVAVAGSYTGVTDNFELSFDGGTTFPFLLSMNRGDTNATLGTNTGSLGNATVWWEAAVPAGATHFRVRNTAWTSGSQVVYIGISDTAYEPAPTMSLAGQVAIALQGNRHVQTATAGNWWDDSVTSLAANASFTSGVRDLAANASNGGFGSSSMQASWRAVSISDVTGTLSLEISRDNTTWRRIRQVNASNVGTGGLYTVEMEYKPASRYVRMVYTNGPTLQTIFQLNSLALAA